MQARTLKIILGVVIALVLVEFAYIAFGNKPQDWQQWQMEVTMPETARTEPETEPETEAVTAAETEAAPETAAETEAETVPETEPETEAETEPETQPETQPEDGRDPNRYTLTFVGDCTLGSAPTNYGVMYSLIWTVGEDYDYPFRNVVDYFKNDDFTIANLEGVLTDSTTGRNTSAQFTFRGPTAYTQILTGSSVEAVTLANNHSMDYGKVGYESTTNALTEAGVTFVEQDNSAMYTTDRGLKIGLYAAAFKLNSADMRAQVAKMRSEGADIIIAAMHWGVEGSYRPNDGQIDAAHTLIDAGVDIVYGSHPHVLQPIEEYKDGIIYYSTSNFCFGGHHWPQDLDSVVLQQEIIRGEDGKCRLGELTRIPVSCSSLPVQNNFQPTPYEEGSEKYLRALSKLDGTFKGFNLVVNYN